MGVPIFILGQSGTGKSTSLRNFKSDEITLINVMSKPLPFKGRFAETKNVDKYEDVLSALDKSQKKTIVIDDAQYIMANEFMRRSAEKGFEKFTEIGTHFWSLVKAVECLPYDTVVYFLMHTDISEGGQEKAKTIGKMLDEKICLEGMVSVVLKTSVIDGKYSFLTQNSGKDTVKSPLGMFDTYEIDNDLKMVDTTIRKYWELDIPFDSKESAEIMAEHDAVVDAGGVSTDAPKVERASRRRKSRDESPKEKVGDVDENGFETVAVAEEEEKPKERRRRRRD